MRTLDLPDGRRLAYDDVGDPSGQPAIWHHGSMTSRLFRHPDDSTAVAAGVRLICPDRPGYGRSSPQRHRTLLDWARDIRCLADHLGLAEFSVAGASAGAPNAVAVARLLGDRVNRVVLVSPLGPLGEAGALGELDPALARPVRLRNRRLLLRIAMSPLARLARTDPSGWIDKWAEASSAPDRRVLTDPRFREMLQTQAAEAFRGGPLGLVDELGALYDWGFAPEEVRQHVDILHGDADTTVSLGMAQRLASRFPDARLQVIPDAGHLLVLDHWDLLLESLTIRQTGPARH